MAGGAWCPKRQIESGVREWLQVDLNRPHVITAVETQGRFDHGRGQEYTEEYTVEYWRPGLDDWRPYTRWDGKQVLSGNTDTSTVVSRELVPPIFATQVRILPHSEHRRTVCLRVELRGCPDHSGIVSYEMPESPATELSDTSYDGERSNGWLSRGLGRLVDGETGDDNYRQDIAPGRGTGWVAWMRDNFPEKYVELAFHFDNLRTFNAVHIYSNNYFKRDVQVFEQADVWFDDGSSKDSKAIVEGGANEVDWNDGIEPADKTISYTYVPDLILENARNVSIALHGRQAKIVRMRLYFAARWIMISEVTFDSFTAREKDQAYVEILIGVLTAISLLLLMVFIVILLISRRQKFQSSPTVLKNPFGFAINMKGFLLNLAPGRMLNSGGHDTPDDEDEDPMARRNVVIPDIDELGNELVAEDEASLRETLGLAERYGSSILEPQYQPTYAVVGNTGISCRERREVELLSSRSFERGCASGRASNCSNSSDASDVSIGGASSASGYAEPISPHLYSSPSIRAGSGGPHYRSLPSQPIPPPLPPSQRTPAHQQREPEYAMPRRWPGTATKDKHKVASAPVVRWNIAPSMGKPYKCKEIEPVKLPGQCLHTMEKLGCGHVGEGVICALVGMGESPHTRTSRRIESHDAESLRLAVARAASPDGSACEEAETMRELRMLAWLSDANLARLLGVSLPTADTRPWAILEYTELGDLAHYLQYSEPLVGTYRAKCSPNLI
ncbi:hypothetical protein QAD02_019571, partial [Eretmocerus hayati]